MEWSLCYLHQSPFDKLTSVMTAAEVQASRDASRLIESADGVGFYLMPTPTEPVTEAETEATTEEQSRGADDRPAIGQQIDAMRETMKSGVRVISAPQLFPTPPHLAARMVELAQIKANLLGEGDNSPRGIPPRAGKAAARALFAALLRRGNAGSKADQGRSTRRHQSSGRRC